MRGHCLEILTFLSFFQAFYSSGVHLTMISTGTALGFTATLIPALKEPGSEIKIDLQMTSLIGNF